MASNWESFRLQKEKCFKKANQFTSVNHVFNELIKLTNTLLCWFNNTEGFMYLSKCLCQVIRKVFDYKKKNVLKRQTN